MRRTFNKQSGDGDFIIAPEGTSAAVLAVLAWLGRHESTYQGETRMRDLVGLSWELAERAEDGRAIAVTEVLTNSLHEKAKLFSRVLALTGGREPPPGFDLEKLLGRGAIVTVVHDLRDGKTWANVAQVGPLPRGMPAPSPSIAPVYYDIEQHDRAAFERLPARFRKLAETGQVRSQAAPAVESPKAKMEARLAAQQCPPAQTLPTDQPLFDDDIPF